MRQANWRVLTTMAALLFTATAHRALAQGKLERDTKDAAKGEVPKEYAPPVGMCRVWLDGVPANQQPAPTDCATAVRNKPANGRVIYGEDKAKGGKKIDDLPIKNLRAGDKKTPPLVPPNFATFDPRARDAFEAKKITDQQLFGDQPARYSPASSFPGGSLSPYGPGTSSSGYGYGANGYGTNGYGTNGYPPSAGYVTPNGVYVPGTVTDPRYFAQGSGVRPPGYGSTVCLDRDGDGWCDDQRFGTPVCQDLDRDGRCDDLPEFASRAYPQVLPTMRAALDVTQGRPSVEIMQWLGTNEFTVRIPDQGRGGVPWRAIFLDTNNQLLQVWTDLDRDGRADRVEIFRNGQRVKLIQR